jgi:hypothetical protein
MSDGPHRSLQMRVGWKRVAERADNPSFAPEEITRFIIPALGQDCRDEMSPGFINSVGAVLRELDNCLFNYEIGSQLEALRSEAGGGIGRTFLDNVVQISANEAAGLEPVVKAMTDALFDHAARAARQVEEHYYRESTMPRAQNVRARIEQAVGDSRIETLARQVLRLDERRTNRPALQQGLDDGVRI